MYENTKVRDATAKKERCGERISQEFCPEFRAKPGVARKEDGAAAADTVCQQMNRPRITKQAKFDWGSFFAFDDGSIEIERAGVKRWFRNFFEMKRSLNQMAKNGSCSY